VVATISCVQENEYIQITEGYSENPSSPRMAIKINNLGEVYYCIQRDKGFTFSEEEKFVFDYFKSTKKIDWIKVKGKFQQDYVRKYIEGNHSYYNKYPSISFSYKLGDTLGIIEDFDYLSLNEEQERYIYDLIEKVDTINAKKIKYYPFNIEILAKPLPIPPKEE
jgi:uncharacterized protein YfkK (UPF0435 family)